MENFEPLFWKDDRRAIPLKEVAVKLGMSTRKLRDYAIAGKIPGAFQIAKGTEWLFERRRLEEWYKEHVRKLERAAKE